MALDNDARGWIMTCVSGIACIVGSSIICVDLIIQCIPGKRNFRIQDSNTFLSASLSLSFGVMLFSSLYSMLPSSKKYLIEGGFSPQAAAYTLIGCFIGGVIAIQVLSRILHHYIPSRVVDCDHTHEDHEGGVEDETYPDRYDLESGQKREDRIEDSERTSLVGFDGADEIRGRGQRSRSTAVEATQRQNAPPLTAATPRRPSLQSRFTSRVSTIVSGAKPSCEEGGPCFGYGEPCAQECFKNIGRSLAPSFIRTSTSTPHKQPTLLRSATTPYSRSQQGPLENWSESSDTCCSTNEQQEGYSQNNVSRGRSKKPRQSVLKYGTDGPQDSGSYPRSFSAFSHAPDSESQAHHHHVPENAFLSIGLQTVIAIALHKLPEGFITYATNHANPTLGFSVFMALFIHNITEGFAMALPLYLALSSRWKAMFWSSLLGGVSQPLGAGIAAIWFKAAGGGDHAPGARVYGCMFAITAGVMTNVALSLFSESLVLTHNKNLCIASAFVGMVILGVSFALTA